MGVGHGGGGKQRRFDFQNSAGFKKRSNPAYEARAQSESIDAGRGLPVAAHIVRQLVNLVGVTIKPELGARNVLARPSIDFDLFTLLNEKRHANHRAGLERSLLATGSSRISLDAGLCLCHFELHEVGKDE